MELEPIPEAPGASLIKVPFLRTANGAIHQLDVAKLAERLLVWELFDMAMWYHEVNHFRTVMPPRSYSKPVAILPGVGKWQTLLYTPKGLPFALKVKPTEALLVPSGCYVGLQSLERNRTSYTVLTHRTCQVTDELDPASPDLLPIWEHSETDRACNELTGKRLSPA